MEINSVIVELDNNRKFWEWMMNKLRKKFPKRNYTRSVRTSNQDVIPSCLAELIELVKEENAIILEPHTDKLSNRLSHIGGGFLLGQT